MAVVGCGAAAGDGPGSKSSKGKWFATAAAAAAALKLGSTIHFPSFSLWACISFILSPFPVVSLQ